MTGTGLNPENERSDWMRQNSTRLQDNLLSRWRITQNRCAQQTDIRMTRQGVDIRQRRRSNPMWTEMDSDDKRKHNVSTGTCKTKRSISVRKTSRRGIRSRMGKSFGFSVLLTSREGKKAWLVREQQDPSWHSTKKTNNLEKKPKLAFSTMD